VNSDCDNKEEFISGITTFLHLAYLQKCLIGEGIIPDDQDNETKLENIIHHYPNSIHSDLFDIRSMKKICNLYEAIIIFLDNPFLHTFDIHLFTPELAKQIHSYIGKNDVIQNCGKYRKKDARPAQSDYWYYRPDLIEKKIEELFEKTRTLMIALPKDTKSSTIAQAIKISATFVGTFLDIHPFSNGNGRVVRLLFSLLMSPFSVVPIPIFANGSKGKNTWLECLEEGKMEYPYKYDGLATFLLEKMYTCMNQTCYLLDLDLTF